VVTYGQSTEADLRVSRITSPGSESSATLRWSFECASKHYEGEQDAQLRVPGIHNQLNAAAAFITALLAGAQPEDAATALYGFVGADRRFTLRGDVAGIKVFDDYAHHPTEIKATLKAIKSIDKSRLVVIFQPHRYSRVHFLLDEFKDAFKDVDKVILLPIYAAGEKNEFNISSEILKEHINHNNVENMNEWKDVKRYVSRVKKDSTYIFMGAGDISTLAHQIAEELEGMSE